MNVLFYTNAFPRYSETFIRDQIINVLNENMNVFIYSGNKKNLLEEKALQGFESYQLLNKIIDDSDLLPLTWKERKSKAIKILFRNILSPNFKFYVKALNKKEFGAKTQNYKLFFFVHYILSNKINIIHCHFGTNGNEALIFKKLNLPLKLLVSFHGYDIRLGIENSGLYKELFKYADSLIAISEFNKKHLLNFGAQEEKIYNLPNGIDLTYFHKRDKKSKRENVSCISVARLVPDKALHIAIEAMSKLIKESYIEIEYCIIGEGEERKKLMQLISDLEMGNHIRLLGVRTTLEVRNLMQEADVFILSSINEVLPTVLLEAQACELPIIATNVGSVAEIVKSGLVVEPNNVKKFHNGLIDLFNQRDKWSVMGATGRSYVEKKFNNKKITRQLIQLYNA